MNRAKSEFLASDGDKRWLQGLEFVPKKLRYLNEINKILAHRPWQITATHIERLTRGTEENWSLSEVVHAIVLMTHFHALASLVWSSGITETDEASTDRENDAPSQVKVAGNGVTGDTKSSSNSVPAAASPSEANFEVSFVLVVFDSYSQYRYINKLFCSLLSVIFATQTLRDEERHLENLQPLEYKTARGTTMAFPL